MSPVEDFSRFATIIPEEHLPALANNLRRIPDFSWLLDLPHAEIERLQGDVLSNFPTVFLDEGGEPRSREFTVLVLNNTCDLPDDRLDFITTAPIVDFNKYLEFERERQYRDKNGLADWEKRRIEDRQRELAGAARPWSRSGKRRRLRWAAGAPPPTGAAC